MFQRRHVLITSVSAIVACSSFGDSTPSNTEGKASKEEFEGGGAAVASSQTDGAKPNDAEADSPPEGKDASQASDSSSKETGGDAENDAGVEAATVVEAGTDAEDANTDVAPPLPICTPGTKQCSGTTPQVCDAQGFTWNDLPACPALCFGGECVVCNPGTRRCLLGTPQVCDGSGNWTNLPACAGSTPICLSGACYECNPGATRCLGNEDQTCTGLGAWQTDAVCPYVCTLNPDAQCTGTCAPGSRRCSTTVIMGVTVNIVETCGSQGAWAQAILCGVQTCVDGACRP